MNIILNKQQGSSLMEVLIAMSISLVVTAAMIALMANSLGTTARIIKMTKLSDDMRIAMQMMTRDVRRSSYNAKSMFCYANRDCIKGSVISLPDSDMKLADIINIELNVNGPGNTCFTFLTDRDKDGDSTNLSSDPKESSAGGFRRTLVAPDPDKPENLVGVIEMWTASANAPNCGAGPGTGSWVQITNPDNMDITAFTVENGIFPVKPDLSYDVVIFDDGVNPPLSQRIRKIRMNMQGRLVMDPTIVRQIEDVIAVRNDMLL